MMRARGLIVASAFALLSSPSVRAQRAVDTIVWAVEGTQFGYSVDGVGDLNGDGLEDFIVGMPSLFSVPARPGSACIYSGADRSVLFQVSGDHPDDWFGHSVAGVGDVDGDLVPDFAAGAPRDDAALTQAGMVRVYSGANGSVLHTWYGVKEYEHFGTAIATPGDVTGDGNSDVLVSGPGFLPNTLGRVRLFSGGGGSVVYEVVGDYFDDQFGLDVSGLGDYDGDGVFDFVVAAPNVPDTENSYARVFSGPSGSEIVTIPNVDARIADVSSIGDVNGDGRSDVAVGEVLAGPAGGVYVYSGVPCAQVLAVPDADSESFGSALDEFSDLDGDGTPDLLVGGRVNSTVFEGGGTVTVISGATGERLVEVFGDFESEQIGGAVASVRTGGAEQELNFLVPSIAGGRVRLHSTLPVGSTFCTASVNSTNRPASISIEGSNSLSAYSPTLRAAFVPPSMNGLFIYSPDQATTPLGNGTLCLGSTSQGFINRLAPEQADSSGMMEHELDIAAPRTPESLITAGSTWHFQAFFRDIPAGGAAFNFSNAITVTFVP